MMKILVLALDVPATSRMPGSPRLFNLCRELSRHHEMYLMTLCESQSRYDDFINDPASTYVFKRVEILPSPPPASWLGQQRHRIHLAAYFETRFRHREFYHSIRAKILEVCTLEGITLIYVDRMGMAQYVDCQVSVPVIVDMHDSSSLRLTRTLAFDLGILSKLRTFLSLVRAKQLEKAIGKSCDLIITNSLVDECVVKELSGSSRTMTINNGVDMEFFTPSLSEIDPNMLVFSGVMGYHPNEDAALYFARDILPLIRAKCPYVEFWIVGSQPSDRVNELKQIPGIHVTGHVEDVRPFVRKAAVYVCPLRIGSGVKNKILAAMAMQKPTVATSLSIDGLNLADDREVLLADEPQDFADKVVRLLTDQKAAQQLGANGLARVQGEYSWGAMGKVLETAIQSLVASRNGCAYGPG